MSKGLLSIHKQPCIIDILQSAIKYQAGTVCVLPSMQEGKVFNVVAFLMFFGRLSLSHIVFGLKISQIQLYDWTVVTVIFGYAEISEYDQLWLFHPCENNLCFNIIFSSQQWHHIKGSMLTYKQGLVINYLNRRGISLWSM